MSEAIAAIFLCQLLGEVVARAFALPLPGPVAGMALMFAFLLWRGRKGDRGPNGERIVPEKLARTAEFLLRHLSLLFVPAAVGLIRHFGLLRDNARPLLAALIGSTVLAMLTTAWVFRGVSNWRERRAKP